MMQRLVENFAVMNAWFFGTFFGVLGRPMRRNIAWFGQKALGGSSNTMGMFLDDLEVKEADDGKDYDVSFKIDKDKLDRKMERLEDRNDHRNEHLAEELGYYMDYGWDGDVEVDDIDVIEMSYKKKDKKRVWFAKIHVEDIKKDGDGNYKVTGDFDRKKDEVWGELEDVRLTFFVDNFSSRHWDKGWRTRGRNRRHRN